MDAERASGRKRIKLACDECRKGKRKCGGQRPTCDLCEKASRACTYSVGYQIRKRKYWDEDYVHSLEDQVSLLQRMLRDAQAKDGETTSPLGRADDEDSMLVEQSAAHLLESTSGPVSVHKFPSNSHVEDLKRDSQRTPSEERSSKAMEELSSLMLKMGINDDREPSFTIPPSASTFMSSFRTPDLTIPQRPTSSDVNVPDCVYLVDTSRQFFQLYTENFHPFYPVIDLEDYIELKMMCSSEDSDVRLLGIAICAVGAHFADKSQKTQSTTPLLETVEKLAFMCYRSSPSEMMIKACALLSWLHLAEGNDSVAWQYTTMATSAILLAGIHVTTREKKSDLDKSPVMSQDSSRIRTFWTYYLIDKMVTAIVGMNCTIPWRRVRVPAFGSILGSDATIPQIVFDYQCRLWRLWDSSLDQAYAFEWVDLTLENKYCLLIKAHQDLTNFYKSLPPCLRIGRIQVEPGIIYFHLAYHTALILIHRPFLGMPLESTTLHIAIRSVTTAAASVSRLIRHFQRHHSFTIAPLHVINYILSAAIIHLLNATSGRHMTLGRQSASGLASCLCALEEMQVSWPARAKQSIRLVQELAQRWHVLWAMPIRLSHPIYPPFGEDPHTNLWDQNNFGGMLALERLEQDLGQYRATSVPDFWESMNDSRSNIEKMAGSTNGQDIGYEGLDWLFTNGGYNEITTELAGSNEL